MLTSKELSIQTGASYRQIDYWCRNSVIIPLGKNTPGTGFNRKFDDSIVDKVELLVRMSKSFDGCRTDQLKLIYENYDKGFVELEAGIIISWKKETNATNETPAGGD